MVFRNRMSAIIDDFIKSGRRLITDTKASQPKSERPKDKKGRVAEPTGDAHDIFVRRCIKEKPSKKEVLEDIRAFIKEAEAKI